MKFSSKNISKIIDKYHNEFNTYENRKFIIDELNETFFPNNVAQFIDYTKDNYDTLFIKNMSLMIKYKDSYYNILAFEIDALPKIIRIQKLLKISQNE